MKTVMTPPPFTLSRRSAALSIFHNFSITRFIFTPSPLCPPSGSTASFLNSLLPKSKFLAAIALFAACSNAYSEINVDIVDYKVSMRSPVTDQLINPVTNQPWAQDIGGTAFIAVRNTGTTNETISRVLLNGTDISTITCVQDLLADQPEPGRPIMWWRAEPEVLSPGQYGGIWIHANGSPLRSGESIDIQVECASGASAAKYGSQLSSSPLVISQILPSEDRQTIDVYLRNDGTTAFRIEQARLNGNSVYDTVGGLTTIHPKEVFILKFDFDSPLPALMPCVAYVNVTRLSDNLNYWTASAVRLVEPGFVLAANDRNKDINASSEGIRMAKSLLLDSLVLYKDMQAADWTKLSSMRDLYHMDAIGGFLWTDPATVASGNNSNTAIRAWKIMDEPELYGYSSKWINLVRNLPVVNNDQLHPTYLNLNVDAVFNEFGNIADIVSYDRYDNETVSYQETLKLNTEPRRMWTYTRLSSPDFPDAQPWEINYQFWSHVMYGAKGNIWYEIMPNTATNHQNLFAEAEQVHKEITQIRGLCFSSDPADQVSIRSLPSGSATTTRPQDVTGRLLVGEQAVVLILTNRHIEGNTVDVSFHVPPWIQKSESGAYSTFRVNADGSTWPACSVDGQVVTIPNVYLEKDSYIFVLTGHQGDTEPPLAPRNPTIATYTSPTDWWLSWGPPFDNFGIFAYSVYRNGTLLETVRTPLLHVTESQAGEVFEVEAIDTYGNRSQRSSIAFVPPTPPTLRVLYQDDFSGGTTPIDGRAPDIRPGVETWADVTQSWGANGVKLGSNVSAATLPISITSGAIYSATISLNPTAGATDAWMMLGFFGASGENSTTPFSSGAPWVLYRDSGEVITWAGQGLTGSTSLGSFTGSQTFTVRLDTTDTQWTSEFLINGISTGAPVAYAANPTLSFVGFGNGGTPLLGSVSSFEVTMIPNYTSWATTNAGSQAANLDWDKDSVSNGVEYFMNAPAGFTANPCLVGNAVTWPNGGNILSSQYGTRFVVQTSANLVNWTDVPGTDPNLVNASGSVSYAVTGTGKQFVRLKVTPN